MPEIDPPLVAKLTDDAVRTVGVLVLLVVSVVGARCVRKGNLDAAGIRAPAKPVELNLEAVIKQAVKAAAQTEGR